MLRYECSTELVLHLSLRAFSDVFSFVRAGSRYSIWNLEGEGYFIIAMRQWGCEHELRSVHADDLPFLFVLAHFSVSPSVFALSSMASNKFLELGLLIAD